MKTLCLSLLALALLATTLPHSAFANGKGQAVRAVDRTARTMVAKTLKQRRVDGRALVSSSVTSLRSRSHRGRVDVDCKVELVVVPRTHTTLATQAITIKGTGAVRSARSSVAAAEKSCVAEVAQQLTAYKVAPALR